MLIGKRAAVLTKSASCTLRGDIRPTERVLVGCLPLLIWEPVWGSNR